MDRTYCLFSCSFSPSYYISQYYSCYSLARCPLPYVAGTTLFFLFSSLYCFYARLLPGMHGPGVPGGPIVSGCGSPAASLSACVGCCLRPVVGRVPSCVRGTARFLRTLGGFVDGVPRSSILVAFGVESLCTNIPHDEGVNCCSVALRGFCGGVLPLPLGCVTQFVGFVLGRSCFRFRNGFCLRVRGAAVGSPFAPGCAGVFVGAVGRRVLGSAPGDSGPVLWLRFVDGVFAVWALGGDGLFRFFGRVGSVRPAVGFEVSQSRGGMPFLDTLIILANGGGVRAALCRRPAGVSPLLRARSFHPGNCKTGIIYSQALRYRRIISNNEDFEHHLKRLLVTLLKRGYNIGLINEMFAKVRSLSRDDLLQYHKRSPTQKFPFVIPFNWNTLHIGKKLHCHWHLIHDDQSLRGISSAVPIMAFKRNRNIKDILVNSNFDY